MIRHPLEATLFASIFFSMLSSPLRAEDKLDKPLLQSILIAEAKKQEQPKAQAQPTSDGDADIFREGDEGYEEEENVVVVGTRLKTSDESARVQIINGQDIEQLGISSFEDILRIIPQNFSSINSTNNTSTRGILDDFLGDEGVGVATANLRGLGSGNTLVLLNGRRISGTAGQEGFFANLRDIPVAAIERVEVNLNGGSAVYGADGVGGIINIVTKAGYSGGTIRANLEQSSNDMHSQQLSAYFGKSWGSGDISVTLNGRKQDPVNVNKAGHVRRDYREFDDRYIFLFEGETRYPIVSARSEDDNEDGPYDQGAPITSDGRNLSPEDYITISPLTHPEYYENRPSPKGSEEQNDQSATLNINQRITDTLRLNLELLYTKSKSRLETNTNAATPIAIPDTNAFNPFGREVYVAYNPISEIQRGLLPRPFIESESEQLRYALGLQWELSKNWLVALDYVNSESEASSVQAIFDDDSDLLSIEQAEAIENVLASDDPNVAVNLFGDGSFQNDGIRALHNLQPAIISRSILEEFTAYTSGKLLSLPGGDLSGVLGVQQRVDGIRGDEIIATIGGDPDRDLIAYFAEFALPIVGKKNALPGIQSLSFTAQFRRDEYEMQGARGGEFDEETFEINPEIVNANFSHTSPRFGLAWTVNNALTIRASVSESFKAPDYTDLFNTDILIQDVSEFGTYDPLIDDFVLNVPSSDTANPDLQPEIASNTDLGFTLTPGFLPNFSLDVNYSEIDFKDRIASSNELSGLLTLEEFGRMEEFFIRDENGNLLEVIQQPINVSREINRTLDITARNEFPTQRGSILATLNYLRVLMHETTPVEGANSVDFSGFSQGQDQYRVNARLDWYHDNWVVSSFINYTPSYISNEFEPRENENSSIPNAKVDSYTTVDLSISYDGFDDFLITFGARNLFDADFPFILRRSSEPYDTTRVDLAGRVTFLNLNYEF